MEAQDFSYVIGHTLRLRGVIIHCALIVEAFYLVLVSCSFGMITVRKIFHL